MDEYVYSGAANMGAIPKENPQTPKLMQCRSQRQGDTWKGFQPHLMRLIFTTQICLIRGPLQDKLGLKQRNWPPAI